MLLQESVQMIPQFGNPVQHPDQVIIGQAAFMLWFHQLSVQIAHQEAIGWFHIIGESHHPDNENMLLLNI